MIQGALNLADKTGIDSIARVAVNIIESSSPTGDIGNVNKFPVRRH